MKQSFHKLQKFFKLEAERGFDNRAVMGGLESILESWKAEARADNIPENLIQIVHDRLRDYQRLSEDSRNEALHGLWQRIRKETDSIDPTTDEISSGRISTINTPQPQENIPSKKAPPSNDTYKTQSSPEPSPETDTGSLNIALTAPITVLPRVGPRYEKSLDRLGLRTLGDMLYFFPRRYDDYTQLIAINSLNYGEEVTIIGSVTSVNTRNIKSGKSQIVEAIIDDGSGVLRITWFNQPWLAPRLKKVQQIVLSGKIEQYLGRLVMNNPEWEPLEQKQLHTNRIVPVYPLTAKITQRYLRGLINQVVNQWAPQTQDPIPKSIREKAQLIDLPTALLQIHFPDSWKMQNAAQERLAFDEILLLQLGVLSQKRIWKSRSARVFAIPEGWLDDQIQRLPFKLTKAQERVLNDVRHDLASGHPMNRLLQGDVGSGKTIIAALGIAMITRVGSQAALMAPTSILAEQHYSSLLPMLTSGNDVLKPDEIRLMIGATPESEKKEIRDKLEKGEIKLIIGTHALIEDPVKFFDLELVIVDEQHRFGVKQRASLRVKGTNPHLFVMTATPIPRSLALTVYGDLDISIIDEMPPGRQPIKTFILYPKERERAYSMIRGQVKKGHQAFIIYPLVEASDKSEERAAVEEHARLKKEIFPDYGIGLLHGRLKPKEKEDIMAGFRDGEYRILVSTSVVEVGVDVPNATVMLIEGAHRFGLAQLHQFRGRVGRGEAKSYCLLIPTSDKAIENERLQAMSETNDGFILAERDLASRGPGEFLGTRQSGYTELRMANLTNVRLIEKARRHAKSIFENDPDLSSSKHKLLSAALKSFWKNGVTDIS